MQEIGLQQLKELQIQILDHVAEFCCTHQINYWLDSGTLLGQFDIKVIYLGMMILI